MDKNGLIGVRDYEGKDDLPWHGLTEDLNHLKQVTMGHPLVMGSTTLLSLPGVLPGRPHRVLTTDEDKLLSQIAQHAKANRFMSAVLDGRITFHSSLDDALGCEEPFIMGGASVYKQTLNQGLVDRMYLTLVDEAYGRNLRPEQLTFMPEIPFSEFRKLTTLDYPKSYDRTNITPRFTINLYEKR